MQNTIITFLKDHLGNKPAVLGLSGGIDSTVVAYVLAQAIPADRIHGLIMPTLNNDPRDLEDAQRVADKLNIKTTSIELDPIIEIYQSQSNDFQHPLAKMNLASRSRMILLYGRANAVGGLVVGTGNRSELLSGYFSKYGDGGVDLLPIGHLYKTQVWELAKQLGVFPDIIAKAPSAGLVRGQTDEQDLGMTYQELDVLLQAIIKKEPLSQFNKIKVQRTQSLMATAQHKLRPIPIPQLEGGV